MFLTNLKKIISLNVLAFFGYLYLIACLWLHYFVRPDIMGFKGDIGSDPETVAMVNASFYINAVFYIVIICFVISLLFIIFALIEAFFRKKGKLLVYIPLNNHIYSFLFWFGLILQLTPVCFVIITFLEH